MELTIGASVTFVSCLYLLVIASPVSGKCHGKWAIHACFGGNGKRSDPSMNSEPSLEPSLLHRALMSDAERLSRMLQLPIIAADPLAESDNTESQRSMALSTDEYDDGGIKDNAEERYNSLFTRDVPDVSDIRRYVRALKLQHAMRKKEADLY
ncbi:hypothetical protein BsWGS_12736 [Bradybaena similaris]